MRRSREQAPGRFRRTAARVPASLAGLLATVALIGLAWALTVPPWQSPDEVAHFAYAESLAARHALPRTTGGSQASTDQQMADAAVGASRGAFEPPSSPPSWSGQTFRAYVAASPRYAHSNGGGSNPNATNPPLYYLYADVAYLIDGSGNAFGELYAIRIWGVLLLGLTTLAGWLLAGEVLGRRRIPQLICGAVMGLLPMTTFMSTNVNPDALMIVLWSWALWLGARVINRSARRRDAVALCAVTAAAVLTKATSYALVVPVLVALGLGVSRRAPDERRAGRRDIAIALTALVVPILAWLAVTVALHRPAVNKIAATAAAKPFNVSQLVSYVWQFYLPRLPFMTSMRETSGLPVYDIWVRQFWGAFGWLDVTFPGWAYGVLGAITAAVLVPASILVGNTLSRRNWRVAAFLGLAGLALLAFLHLADYRSLIAGQGQLVQGRYLLPIVGLFALAVAFLASRLSPARQAAVCGVVVASLLTLQVLSLSTIVHAYYV